MAREYTYTDMRLCMWEAREILWAAFDTRYARGIRRDTCTCLVALGSECRVELECSTGVRELTSSIFYARCRLLGYVRSALCLESRMRGQQP